MTKSKEYMQEDDVVTYIRKVDWNLGIRAKKEMTWRGKKRPLICFTGNSEINIDVARVNNKQNNKWENINHLSRQFH